MRWNAEVVACKFEACPLRKTIGRMALTALHEQGSSAVRASGLDCGTGRVGASLLKDMGRFRSGDILAWYQDADSVLVVGD